MKLPADSVVGILPAGALGVAFAAHLSADFSDTSKLAFLPRSESSSENHYTPSSQYSLKVDNGCEVRFVETPPVRLQPLPKLGIEETPRIILAGPMPDQLFSVLRDLVSWLSQISSTAGLDEAIEHCPVLVMTSNGIYFQRLRRYYLELLEEAVMLGVLPELWPDNMPSLIGRLLRGVTIQTGLRTGAGENAIYRPGPSGWTTLAGGDREVREATSALLQSRGMTADATNEFNPTRIEFDKATVNLAGNLFGQILSISEDGKFEKLTIGETHARLDSEEVKQLADTLVSIGKAVRAYPESYSASTALEFLEKATAKHSDHVASSVQLLESRIQSGTLEAKLPPTEAWLLDPLINYARARHLEREETYLVDLKSRLLEALERAIKRKPQP